MHEGTTGDLTSSGHHPGSSFPGSTSPGVRRSALILALAACLLLVVAVGARGSPSGALALSAAPAAWQTACYILVGIVIGVTIAGLPVALMARRRSGSAAVRRPWWQQLASLLLPVALLAAVLLWWSKHPLSPLGGTSGSPEKPLHSTPLPPPAPPQSASPILLLVAVLIGILAAVLVALVVVMRARARRGIPVQLPDEAPRAVAAVDAAIEVLGSERDPRRAVIAAYATMERLLGAAGSPRRAADSPTEHLERSLVLLGAGRSAARRLTELFERARFSAQVIDEAVRQAALEALAAVRRDLEPA
jgi:hypothetical protein